MNNIIFNTGSINGNITQDNYGNNANETKEKNTKAKIFKYDIAISYASEQEGYVYRVARLLEQEGLNVFYAPNKEEEFWGKDLITAFYSIYRYESSFVACFISADYLQKDITVHEAKTVLLREKDEGRNCLIPIYFGGVRLDGLNTDIQYMNGNKLREVEVADKIKTIVASFKSQE